MFFHGKKGSYRKQIHPVDRSCSVEKIILFTGIYISLIMYFLGNLFNIFPLDIFFKNYSNHIAQGRPLNISVICFLCIRTTQICCMPKCQFRFLLFQVSNSNEQVMSLIICLISLPTQKCTLS